MSDFDHAVRVLTCDGCGAPQPVPLGGGASTCRHCGAVAHLLAREEPDLTLPGFTEADEAVRLSILRAQCKPTTAPPNVADVNLSMATDYWRRSVTEVRAASSAEGESTLVVRGEDLANHLAVSSELLRARAVVESTLELVRSRRFTQTLRCWMARMAVQEGDDASAAAWLARCDPRAEDLAMDSAWRFSWAAVQNHRGRHAEVLELLGERSDAVPISGSFASLAGFVRAHALEQLRGAEAAADELTRVADAHPHGWPRIAELHAHQPTLCPQALALTARRWRRDG